MRLPVEYPHEIPHGIYFALARTGGRLPHYAGDNAPCSIATDNHQKETTIWELSRHNVTKRHKAIIHLLARDGQLYHIIVTQFVVPDFYSSLSNIDRETPFAEYFSPPPIILYIFILYTFAPSVFHLLPRDVMQTGMNDAPRNGKTRMYTTERAIHHTTVIFVKLQGDTTITACYSTEK